MPARHSRQWTDEELAKLMRLINEGVSLGRMSVALGRTSDVIKRKTALMRRGVSGGTMKSMSRQVRRSWSHEELDELARLVVAGVQPAQIAVTLGRSISAVETMIARKKLIR